MIRRILDRLRDWWEAVQQLEAARMMCRHHEKRRETIEAKMDEFQKVHDEEIDKRDEELQVTKARLAGLEEAFAAARTAGVEIRAPYQGGAVEPVWEAEDAARLMAFLKSQTGARLKARVNFQEQKVNREAIWMKDRIENATGYARGFGDGLYFITCDLPVFAPPQEGPANKVQPGDAALVERLSP